MESLFFAIGKALDWTFGIFRSAEDSMNWIFIVVMSIGVLVWLNKQSKYNKEAEANGTMK